MSKAAVDLVAHLNEEDTCYEDPGEFLADVWKTRLADSTQRLATVNSPNRTVELTIPGRTWAAWVRTTAKSSSGRFEPR